jgi:small-conductance mechanosensitive channel
VAESKSRIEQLSDSEYWKNLLERMVDWVYTSIASTDTLIELAVIVIAALITWPVASYLSDKLVKIRTKNTQNSLMGRLWSTATHIAYPFCWLIILWLSELAMDALEMRHGLVMISSSMLTAWVIISVATIFVANPIGRKVISLFAWIIAALNIVGLLDETVNFLESASFSFGKSSITALAVIQAIIALALLLWATAIAGQLLESRIKRSDSLTPSFQVLSTKLLRIGLAILAVIFTLSIVGIDLTVFAVFGGAIGVGLGFGLQKIFANLISGFILLVDKSIKPGDVIAVDDDYGTVSSLGARYVSVLTRDGIEHLIPNEELITTKVENWSHSNNLLRLRKMVGIHYKSDVRLAMSLCMQAMDETARILKDPAPNCLLLDFGDNSVNIEMRYWVDDPMNGRANVTSELMLAVWDKFHENEIEIPYPQRDLHLRSSDLSKGLDGALLSSDTNSDKAS